ncbi:MAG: hypothetical protein F4060_07265 [Holophagales bacterium]|nr:hypothetical protein [Holophagales bacterium]MYG31882.1 hypothetical protein [Holophagales bacterium]MYI79724.1 hypothetical protein [Holophagales bacterium]
MSEIEVWVAVAASLAVLVRTVVWLLGKRRGGGPRYAKQKVELQGGGTVIQVQGDDSEVQR